jgi:2-keto-4-pentenoate hydratase/2-oxohepta-3-ene-1,7-dioic acid hydratase in catechol pathway
MLMNRRALFSALPAAAMAMQSAPRKWVRFRHGGAVAHGLLEGATVRQVRGGPLEVPVFTGQRHELSKLQLLYPIVPPKVWAVGLNYRSHLGSREAPKNPEIFLKPVTCLQDPEGPIIVPPDAKNLHYEAELVIVVGKRVRRASREEAAAAIFGYTCGNDVSERDWQNGPERDLQWWRAKGADTFGPMGPLIVTKEWNPQQSSIRLRLNGQVKQEQKLSDLIFDCPAIVEFISRYATLEPGDVIFTGTPGTTSAMKPGDVVEVEIDGIGTLRNPVRAGVS